MLRIIAGKFKGYKLLQPQTLLTRPTTDKVKEALFSSLNSQFINYNQQWQNLKVVDFFAGSGSLVFESLSRGASYGLAIDHGPEALRTLKLNKEKLGLTYAMGIQNLNVIKLPSPPMQFSLIFLDPPYNFEGLHKLVDEIVTGGWCQSQAWIVFELPAQATLLQHDYIDYLVMRKYGRIQFVIGRLKN